MDVAKQLKGLNIAKKEVVGYAKCRVTSTHKDLHNERLTLHALQKIKRDYTFEKSLMYSEHDHSKPPIGKVIDLRIEELEDGEHALSGSLEIFDKDHLELIKNGVNGKKMGVSISFTMD